MCIEYNLLGQGLNQLILNDYYVNIRAGVRVQNQQFTIHQHLPGFRSCGQRVQFIHMNGNGDESEL